jgi:hypothetical protein
MNPIHKILCAGVAFQTLLVVLVNLIIGIGIRVEFHVVHPSLQGSLRWTSLALLLHKYGLLLILFPPLWAFLLIVCHHNPFHARGIETAGNAKAIIVSGVLFTALLIVLLLFSVIYSANTLGFHEKLSGGH